MAIKRLIKGAAAMTGPLPPSPPPVCGLASHGWVALTFLLFRNTSHKPPPEGCDHEKKKEVASHQ